MSARSILRAALCLTVLTAPRAGAQADLTVLSLDHLRTDGATGESRHEILPMAVFDGSRFLPLVERGTRSEANARREQLLAANRRVQVLFRGRRIGVVTVAEIDPQLFHCTGLVVGRGDFAPDTELPDSEMRASVWAWLAGETIEYTTQAFFAVSGAIDQTRTGSETLVTVVTDAAELERLALEIDSVEPRVNLLPLGEDETRAYRLDNYGAVVVVRKRRSAAMLQGPADIELPSPLMTDIVVIRAGTGERIVYPLYRSVEGTDAWGKGEPDDRFIDAFELGDGTAYLAFHRRNYEAQLLRIFRLESDRGATLVFEDDLYGC